MSNHVVPTLQASVICEDIRQEINGMQSLVGVLTVVPAAKVPVGLLKLCVWTRWIKGEGRFTQTSRLIAPDGKTAIGEAKVEFELKSLNSQATNINVFAGVQFKEFGVYQIEIQLDGNVVTRYPLVIAQAKAPEGAPAAKKS
mgnify:CR=1 FL=1